MADRSQDSSDTVLWRYGLAIVFSGLFLLLKLVTRRYLGDTVPFVLFFSAVMVSAWIGGLGPGILATALCTCAAGAFFMQADLGFWGRFWPLFTFAVEGIGISLLTDSRKQVLAEGKAVLQRERTLREQAEQMRQKLSEALENVTVEMAQRKSSEESLRASEERRKLALDSAQLGEWHLDPTTMKMTADSRFRAILGITNEPVDYEEAFDRVHPEDRDRILEQVAAACQIEAPEPFAIECRLLPPGGAVRWVLGKGRANASQTKIAQAHPDKGTGWSAGIASFDGTVADITDRKLAENRASTILESVTDAFFALNREWRFNYVNPQAERVLGRKPGDLLGEVIWEVFPGLNGSGFEAVYRDAMTKRMEGSITSFYPDHDRWYEMRAYPSPDGVSVYFRDVSENKRAEEERRRLSAEVQRQVRIFDTTLSSITDFAYILDKDAQFVYANKSLLDLWGLKLEEAVGKNFFDLKYPDELAGKLARQVRQVFETKTGLSDEAAYTSPKGADGFYEYIFSPVVAADGSVEMVVGSTRDVTLRKRTEAQLLAVAEERQKLLTRERQARAEAERAGRMKDEFLATLSHELRTPLNAILGWSQLLKAGGREGADFEQGMEVIDRNARIQTQIIEDLLDMSRIISGKVRLDVQRIDLPPVVQAAVDALKPTADAKGVRMHVVLDPRAGPVSGDPNRLQQIFWNLLSNAVKFTARGGRVQVLLERVNSHLELSVIDTGEGIAPEFLPFVFDRFRQSDASTTRRHGGLGLGLAIVKQLVELHGGSIGAKSPGEGLGSTFTVSLPMTVIHPEPAEPVERRHPEAKGAAIPAEACADIAGLKILVVDDEPDARALMKRLLESCNAEVIVAASAQEAVDRLRAERPDVIASDIGMPGEDGYSLIRRIRALPADQGGETPAMALTAFARGEDRVKALMAGFRYHVAKPVDPRELITLVASLAGRTRSGV
jgi:PAS domain S-box-containing protein